MKEKLKKLQENSLLEVSNWWGLRNPGTSGTIITQDKMLYHYTIYYRESSFLTDNNIPLESLSKGRKITEEEYSKVIEFIENNIVGKNIEPHRIFDAGFYVRGHFNNKPFNIVNDKGYKENPGIYDITKEFINTIKGEN